MGALHNLITVDDIAVAYTKKNYVLEGISFSLQAGQNTGFIGLNGQGKTTLIKSILGLRSIQKGAVKLHCGHHNIAYLPENFMPPLHLNGYEFIDFSLSLHGVTRGKKEVLLMADMLDLGDSSLQKKIASYSKGMRQKIGLIATFLTKAQLIILDEPMNGLDPKGRYKAKNLIKQAQKEDRSVFIVSHILNDFDDLCDRLLVLHNKSIKFDGDTVSFKQNYNAETIEEAFLNLLKSV